MFLPNELKDQTVYIIGGGPSRNTYLPDDKLPLLEGKSVIVTNNAYKLFPNAFCLHFMDHAWWTWNDKYVPSMFKGKYITFSCASLKGKQTPNFFYIQKDGVQGISKNISKVKGSNAGHQAINIAINLGSKNIVLIGFDMDAKAKQTHWHKEHQRPTNVVQYTEVMLPNLMKTAEEIKALGVNVYNLNPESAIKCFPFESKLEEILEKLP